MLELLLQKRQGDRPMLLLLLLPLLPLMMKVHDSDLDKHSCCRLAAGCCSRCRSATVLTPPP